MQMWLLFLAVIVIVVDAHFWSNKTDRVSVYLPMVYQVQNNKQTGWNYVDRKQQRLIADHRICMCVRFNKISTLNPRHTNMYVYFKKTNPGRFDILKSQANVKYSKDLLQVFGDMKTQQERLVRGTHTAAPDEIALYYFKQQQLDARNTGALSEQKLQDRLDARQSFFYIYNKFKQATECQEYFKKAIDPRTRQTSKSVVRLVEFMVPKKLGSKVPGHQKLYNLLLGYGGIWRGLTLDRSFARIGEYSATRILKDKGTKKYVSRKFEIYSKSRPRQEPIKQTRIYRPVETDVDDSKPIELDEQ